MGYIYGYITNKYPVWVCPKVGSRLYGRIAGKLSLTSRFYVFRDEWLYHRFWHVSWDTWSIRVSKKAPIFQHHVGGHRTALSPGREVCHLRAKTVCWEEWIWLEAFRRPALLGWRWLEWMIHWCFIVFFLNISLYTCMLHDHAWYQWSGFGLFMVVVISKHIDSLMHHSWCIAGGWDGQRGILHPAVSCCLPWCSYHQPNKPLGWTKLHGRPIDSCRFSIPCIGLGRWLFGGSECSDVTAGHEHWWEKTSLRKVEIEENTPEISTELRPFDSCMYDECHVFSKCVRFSYWFIHCLGNLLWRIVILNDLFHGPLEDWAQPRIGNECDPSANFACSNNCAVHTHGQDCYRPVPQVMADHPGEDGYCRWAESWKKGPLGHPGTNYKVDL